MYCLLFLELTIGSWGVYVGSIAFMYGHVCGLLAAGYSGLAVLLALQNLLTYNSPKSPIDGVQKVCFSVVEAIAKGGFVAGIVISVLMSVQALIDYQEQERLLTSHFFNAVWSMITIGWSWLILGRLSDMENTKKSTDCYSKEDSDDELCLLEEDDKKIMEYYYRNVV